MRMQQVMLSRPFEAEFAGLVRCRSYCQGGLCWQRRSCTRRCCAWSIVLESGGALELKIEMDELPVDLCPVGGHVHLVAICSIVVNVWTIGRNRRQSVNTGAQVLNFAIIVPINRAPVAGTWKCASGIPVPDDVVKVRTAAHANVFVQSGLIQVQQIVFRIVRSITEVITGTAIVCAETGV